MAVQLAKAWLDAGIVTKDPDMAHRFYGEALGLPLGEEREIPGYGTVRRYAVGDSVLRVFVPVTEPATEGSRDGFASQTGIRYLTLYVRNLEQVVAEVEASGFRVAVAVRDLRPGVRVAQVEDADGNAVELMEER
jgi:catechol 2,3-dioxygenase-like lactoylglutathione lyase family enzyme